MLNELIRLTYKVVFDPNIIFSYLLKASCKISQSSLVLTKLQKSIKSNVRLSTHFKRFKTVADRNDCKKCGSKFCRYED